MWHRAGMTIVTALAPRAADAADAAGAGWSGTQLALRFGVPVALLLVGLVIYLYGRTRRGEIQEQARSEGAVDEQAGVELRTATGQVLSGLVLMLVSLVLLFAVIIWRVVSGAA